MSILSHRLQDLRQSEVRKSSKLVSLAGPNWRKTRYLMVVSSVHASPLEIRSTITIDELSYVCASVNSSSENYVLEDTSIDISRQTMCVCKVISLVQLFMTALL